MGIWTSVTIEATTRADKHISILKTVQEHADGHDIVFYHRESSSVANTLVTHKVEFRIELDGEYALNFLQKLNKHLRTICCRHTMEIYGLLMY